MLNLRLFDELFLVWAGLLRGDQSDLLNMHRSDLRVCELCDCDCLQRMC